MASRGQSACRIANRSRSVRRSGKWSPAIPSTSGLRCPVPSRPSRPRSAGKVTRGEVLITLEAMKMETAVRAEMDGEVAEVVTKPGAQVDAKDLLVVLA